MGNIQHGGNEKETTSTDSTGGKATGFGGAIDGAIGSEEIGLTADDFDRKMRQIEQKRQEKENMRRELQKIQKMEQKKQMVEQRRQNNENFNKINNLLNQVNELTKELPKDVTAYQRVPESKYHLIASSLPPNPESSSWYHHTAPLSQNFGSYVCLKRETLGELGVFLRDALGKPNNTVSLTELSQTGGGELSNRVSKPRGGKKTRGKPPSKKAARERTTRKRTTIPKMGSSTVRIK